MSYLLGTLTNARPAPILLGTKQIGKDGAIHMQKEGGPDDGSGQDSRSGTGERTEQRHETADRNRKLILNFRDISRTMSRLYEGRGSQKRVLILIREAGGSITQRELTERLGIRPGSASELIGKLEKSGLVVRSVNSADRRISDLSLSETGELAAGEALADRVKRHEEMFGCLTDEEKETLTGLLEKINANWRVRYGGTKQRTDSRGNRN